MPRLFVAVNLPEDVRDRILETSRRLQERVRDTTLRWAKPDQYHITLKFIGETFDASVPKIEGALRRVAGETAVFGLSLSHVGTFGDGIRLRNAWVGLAGDVKSLGALAIRIEDELERLGFPKEGRGFSPHITIVRTRRETSKETKAGLAGVLPEMTLGYPLAFQAGRIHLMRSRTLPQGSVYEELAQFAFGSRAT